jgi:putative Mg2+ transporter-C (MgtC) family protein
MPLLDVTLRLLLAAGLGAAIGVERELRHKPAGLRTNILISVGAALFTIVSITLTDVAHTPDRVAAQIVTGVGFLGAGAILHNRRSIHGMTTAATIWVNAAVGMAAGSGQYAMASVATGITIVVLALLAPFEERLDSQAQQDRRHTDGQMQPDRRHTRGE